MALLSIKNIKAAKTLFKIGWKKLKNVTNPIVCKEKCIGTRIDEAGNEISIFRTKRLFSKEKITERKNFDMFQYGEEVSEEALKGQSTIAWEAFFEDSLTCKKIEFTPQILKQIDSLIANGKLNKQYAEIFKNNISKEGSTYIEGCYKDLVKAMGYRKYPELAYIDFYSSSGFNPKMISISPTAFPTKSDKVKALRHELEHFRQEELVYRIFGEEKYINAKINPYIEKLRVNENYCKTLFNKPFTELTETELSKYKCDLYKKIKESCDVFKGARIANLEAAPEEIKEAQIYLKALENYKSPSMVLGYAEQGETIALKNTNPKLYKLAQDYFVEYNLNPLEQGAKNKENEIEKMFEAFIELF